MTVPILYTQSLSKPLACFPKNIKFQYFSIPESLIYYISKNAKSMVYQKLLKCCKYFSRKLQFAVAKSISTFHQDLTTETPLKLDDNISTKIWITGNTLLYMYHSFSHISTKLIYVNVKDISLWYQNITYSEFLLLVSAGNVKNINLISCTIKQHINGALVELSKIMGKLPKLETFVYLIPCDAPFSTFTLETAEKMAKLPIFKNLNHFFIGKNVPTNFINSMQFKLFKKKNSLGSNCFIPNTGILIKRKIHRSRRWLNFIKNIFGS